MRVLHLNTHLNTGGITTYILKLVGPLKKVGVETLVLSSGGSCSDFFRDAGAVTFELSIKTKSELDPRLLVALPRLLRIIRENKIDILHAHTRITQVMAAGAGWIAKIPVVTTCHGFYKRRLGRLLFPAWGKRTIAISQGVAKHLVRDFHVPEEKIRTVNNGVNLEEMDRNYARHSSEIAKVFYGFGEKDPVVGIVARMVEDKGHEYLIRAIPNLQKQFPRIRALIVGDGRHRPVLEKLVKELKLQSQVVFTGNVTDVTQPLAAMDIFSLPATWREGFGLSIVEAMACHKPVIVSNIWSLNALIQDNETGILIEPKQIDPLVEAITRLLKNPEESQAMGSRARKMVEKSFSIDRMAREIHQVYAEVVGENS